MQSYSKELAHYPTLSLDRKCLSVYVLDMKTLLKLLGTIQRLTINL